MFAREIIRPAVDALQAELDVLPSADGTGLSVRSMLIGHVDAVVLDCREGWTAAEGHVLGLAQARAIPVLVLASALDDPQFGLGQGVRRLQLDVNFENDGSVRSAIRDVTTRLSDLLALTEREGSLTPGSDRPADALLGGPGQIAPANFDWAAAQRLIADLFLEGVSDPVIREELLRRGAPPSWVGSRLIRRSGW